MDYHPVQGIQVFIQIFKKENAVIGFEVGVGAEQLAQDAEVSPDQPAFCNSGSDQVGRST